MDYCENGTLKQLIGQIVAKKLTIAENRVWKIIAQFFIALAVMNNKNVAHRDVKDGNIYIDDNDNIILGTIKLLFNICDFFR
jgi:serine/threonine protein kinase